MSTTPNGRFSSTQLLEALLEVVPMGRVATAREIAAAVTYLASDEAAYVTGQVLRINGGMYM